MRQEVQGISTKVVGSTVGGAIGIVVTWALEQAIDEPVPVAVAGAIGIIFTFVLGFLTPEKTPVVPIDEDV